MTRETGNVSSMSKIIVFGNQKGGVGKSTLTTLCANALSQPPFDFKVCVIDNDYQRSLEEARSFDLEEEGQDLPYPILSMNIAQLQDQIYELDQQYDLIFIDTAGKLDLNVPVANQEITKVLMYADYLFIPFRAGSFNMESTLEYVKAASKIKQLKAKTDRGLQFYGFINMYRDRSRTNRYLISEIENLKSVGMDFMLCRLRNYTLFEEIDTINSLYNPNANDKATLNFAVWLNEFVKILKDG